jgi:hypothetical protein
MSTGIQFSTKKFWKELVGVGAAATVQPYTAMNFSGHESVPLAQQMHAPAVHLRGVSLVDTDGGAGPRA